MTLNYSRLVAILATIFTTLLISACGGSSQVASGSSEPPPSGENPPSELPPPQPTFEGPVAKAQCGPDDAVETGLQGQVAQTDRVSGRSALGYNCNLERIGHYNNGGEGAGWQMAWYGDCAYMGTAKNSGGTERPTQQNPGVIVIDVSDPSNPVKAGALTSQAMLDPWESLKVNNARGLLADVDSEDGGGTNFFDIYDINGDCTQPQLLFSGPVGESIGHAGNFVQDGMTYYGSPAEGENGPTIKAIDVSNPSIPVLLHEDFPSNTHDLSASADGNRLYLANLLNNGGLAGINGLTILDVSDIQARVPDPQITVVGEVAWADGALAQMTQALTIQGVPYILFVDENAKGGARLIDIRDETQPVVASKLKLEAQMPQNAGLVSPDQGSLIFGYDGHYCTASDGINDNHTYTIEDAALVVCSYFESGLRVFDIRDPYNPKELAYFIPPVETGYRAGSYYIPAMGEDGNCSAVDWVSAHPRLIPSRNEIWVTSQCEGFHVLRFTTPLSTLMAQSAQR